MLDLCKHAGLVHIIFGGVFYMKLLLCNEKHLSIVKRCRCGERLERGGTCDLNIHLYGGESYYAAQGQHRKDKLYVIVVNF